MQASRPLFPFVEHVWADGGYDHERVFRIGHLGECNELSLLGALSGVEMGLAAAGVPHRPGGVAAAMKSLEENIPTNSAGPSA